MVKLNQVLLPTLGAVAALLGAGGVFWALSNPKQVVEPKQVSRLEAAFAQDVTSFWLAEEVVDSTFCLPSHPVIVEQQGILDHFLDFDW